MFPNLETHKDAEFFRGMINQLRSKFDIYLYRLEIHLKLFNVYCDEIVTKLKSDTPLTPHEVDSIKINFESSCAFEFKQKVDIRNKVYILKEIIKLVISLNLAIENEDNLWDLINELDDKLDEGIELLDVYENSIDKSQWNDFINTLPVDEL